MHVKELLSLKDKVILITGGAGDFGRCMVEGAVEGDGIVISASRNLERQQELSKEFASNGLEVHPMQLDQGDHASVICLKEQIVERFGRLDVFVNNAVYQPMENYVDSLDTFKASMDVNATGSFDILREMSDLIAKSGGGSIINVGSMKGMFSPDFMLYEGTDMDSPPDYSFHKGGMIALAKYMARKLASKKIRVNCISPGGLFANQPEPFLSRYNKAVPMGRMANRDDIKGLIVYLASQASEYLTGENILLDGGLHA